MVKKKLITSALPYVNNVPHLGNIIGCVLSADVYARFCRARGYETLFVCGTDEYGTATENKAREEGLTPQEICDKYHAIHTSIYRWFHIDFDVWGRTSTSEQTEVAQEIFKNLEANGYILTHESQRVYCEHDQQFLADRYVHGTCPECHYEDARGDQCDQCGKLLDPEHLGSPRCAICGNTPTLKWTRHLHLDLASLQPELERWFAVAHKKGDWSHNAVAVTEGWFQRGLSDRPITRDLKWGIPVPKEGFEDKVFYVWFDAPIGYISITKKGREDWRRWWLNADETELYQFMAKDNIPFHTVMFPASLIGSGQPWTLLHHISSTEYLNYEDDKFSKSRGVGVFGNDAIETGIPADLWRFYLIATRPERSDSSFQWHHFFEKVNSEFINNIGNLANRSLTYLSKQFDGEVTREPWDESQLQVIQQLGETIAKVTKAMEQVQLRQALQELLNIGHLANKYYQDAAPWACLKTDRKAAHRIASLPVYVLRSLSILLAPVMPQTAGDLQGILQIHDFSWETASSFTGLEGHFIGKPYILYHLLDESLAEQFRKRFSGQSSEDVSSPGSTPKLVAGRITTVSRHPEADKLYILTVDLNDHQRQVVAGLAPQWTPEELLGKTIVLVANLASATIRGQSSEGMILAAEQGKKKELLQTKEAPGKVLWDSPDEVIQLDEFKRYGLHVDQFQLCGPQGPLHPESPKVHTTLLVRAKVR